MVTEWRWRWYRSFRHHTKSEQEWNEDNEDKKVSSSGIPWKPTPPYIEVHQGIPFQDVKVNNDVKAALHFHVELLCTVVKDTEDDGELPVEWQWQWQWQSIFFNPCNTFYILYRYWCFCILIYDIGLGDKMLRQIYVTGTYCHPICSDN